MVIVQYVKLNFREILPGTLVYLRTMFYIYAREDSLTISRRSKNSNVICSGCFDEVCGADLPDRKRTKLKKNIKELQDKYSVIFEESINKNTIAFYEENSVLADSCMHECKVHCLIIKGALSGIAGGDFGRNRDEHYRDWVIMFKKIKQVVEDMDEAHYQAVNSTQDEDDEEEDVENDDDDDENASSKLPKVDMSEYEFTNDSDVFNVE